MKINYPFFFSETSEIKYDFSVTTHLEQSNQFLCWRSSRTAQNLERLSNVIKKLSCNVSLFNVYLGLLLCHGTR